MKSIQDIAACIVTTGARDITPVLESLDIGFKEVVVWDNSVMPDLQVFGRYAAITQCNSRWIYVQDDDCIVPRDAIRYLAEERRRRGLIVNMPEAHRKGEPQALVGWGAVFEWHQPEDAFRRWRAGGGRSDEVFRRTCDIVFSVLTPFERFDLGHENLPWAHDPDRMHRTPGYAEERAEILEKALSLK